MAIVIKPITVEVSKPNVFQAIAAKQNDSNSRFLKVTFVNEGEKIYVIPSAKVTINAERNDGQSNSFFGAVNDDGTVTVPIHSWILELPGYVDCDVSIIEEDSKLTCTTFTLLVEEASHGSDDISTDEQYDVLGELINEVNNMQPSAIYGSAIPNSKSGTAIAITDISPIEHTLQIKATSDTVDVSTAKVQRYGKNLFNPIYTPTNKTIKMQNSIVAEHNQAYTVSFDKKCDEIDIIAEFADGTTQTKYITFGNTFAYFKIVGNVVNYGNNYGATQTFDKTIVKFSISAYGNASNGWGDTAPLAQFEINTKQTEYEPYTEPTTYDISTGGTVEGVTSLYPTTTLIPDTEGVVLDVNYNVDTKKYIDNKFAELAALIVNS